MAHLDLLTQPCPMELLDSSVFIQALLPMSFQEIKDNALQTRLKFCFSIVFVHNAMPAH